MAYESESWDCECNAVYISEPGLCSLRFLSIARNWLMLLLLSWQIIGVPVKPCCLRSSWLNMPCPPSSRFEGVCSANKSFLGSGLMPLLMFPGRQLRDKVYKKAERWYLVTGDIVRGRKKRKTFTELKYKKGQKSHSEGLGWELYRISKCDNATVIEDVLSGIRWHCSRLSLCLPRSFVYLLHLYIETVLFCGV